MADKHILRLQWKLFFPLVGLLWLIIGIAIVYFVSHEQQRQKENLENRLLNVNNTVVDAYLRGVDLQKTVDFIRLFTDNTTLAPLSITVYDNSGNLLADNPELTIPFSDSNGRQEVTDVVRDGKKSMLSLKKSPDGKINVLAALPYENEVLDFLSIDPMVWTMMIIFGLVSSVLAYLGVMTVCRNVYTLRDFARAVASDSIPDDTRSWRFSKDELGDVSRNLLALYRDKIHAEKEKMHHERQIGMNISHELNTPVSIVKGYIDTLIESPDISEDVRLRFLMRAKQNADRLMSLVNDVSMVMRLQEGTKIEAGDIDFHRFAALLADDVVHGHIAGDMIFTVDIPDGCRVRGHESLLTNAMLNLIYNAVKHSGGTEMSLRWVGCVHGMHFFTFADNGRGVDEKHLGRLFDLFYRVDPGRSRKSGGAGLGLSLVNRIIKAMGGSIEVENADSGGLKFTFSLPDAGVR